MFPPTQDQDTERMLQPTQDNRTLQCVPHPQDTVMSPLPPSYCNKFSPSLKMLRCVLIPPQEAVMCPPPPSGCCDTLLRLRTMRCVLLHGQAAAQAGIAKKVDQHPRPQPEDVAHACEEAAHHLPYTVVLPLRQDAVMYSPPPPGCCVTYHTLRHRMMLRLLHKQAKLRKLTQIIFLHLGKCLQVSPSLPGGNDVCDRQLVTDEQGRIVISVFLLPHIIGGFSLKFYFPPFHILASLPLLLHHRTSTYLTSRPCSAFPSLPCPWLEREPPQSGRCTHTQAVCVPLPPRPCNVVECESAVSQMWRR